MVIKKKFKDKKKNNCDTNNKLIDLLLNDNSNRQINSYEKNDKVERFIVYIKEFDKFNQNGEAICRNIECTNKVVSPFKKYCSKKCSKLFLKWYYSNFYWKYIRNSVLKRDNYTCQLCGVKLYKKKKLNKDKKNWLECDHIVPKSFYPYLGYSFDTLENKIKTIIELIHNENNLRTICYICHKKVTKENLKQKTLLSKG